MANGKAQIEIGIAGADEAVREVGRVRESIKEMGRGFSEGAFGKAGGFKDFGKDIGSGLRSVASDVMRTLTVVKTLDFAHAIQSSKDYGIAVSRMALQANTDLGFLKGTFKGISEATSTPADQVYEWTKAVGALSRNYVGASAMALELGKEAKASGRTLQEYEGLGETFMGLGLNAGQASEAVGRINAQAKALGTNAEVIKDRFAGVKDELEALGAKGKGVGAVSAFLGSFGNGLAPERQAAVQKQALNLLGDVRGIQYFVGHKITDEQGNIANPVQVLKEYRAALIKQFGKRGAERAFMNRGGTQFAAAMMNADFDRILGLSAVQGQAATGKLDNVAQTDLDNAVKNRNNELQVGDDLRGFRQPLETAAANHPYIAAGMALAGASGIGGIAAKYGLKGLGRVIASRFGTAAASTAAEGAAGGGELIPALAGGAGTGLAIGGGLVALSALLAGKGLSDLGAASAVHQGFDITALGESDATKKRNEAAFATLNADANLSPGMKGAIEAERSAQELQRKRRLNLNPTPAPVVNPAIEALVASLRSQGASPELARETAKYYADALRSGQPLPVVLVASAGGDAKGATQEHHANAHGHRQ